MGVDPLAGIDLTPRAIAEYLLITGDFGGFEQAMGDLLNADVVSKGRGWIIHLIHRFQRVIKLS